MLRAQKCDVTFYFALTFLVFHQNYTFLTSQLQLPALLATLNSAVGLKVFAFYNAERELVIAFVFFQPNAADECFQSLPLTSLSLQAQVYYQALQVSVTSSR